MKKGEEYNYKLWIAKWIAVMGAGSIIMSLIIKMNEKEDNK